jgi:hypothetical protein
VSRFFLFSSGTSSTIRRTRTRNCVDFPEAFSPNWNAIMRTSSRRSKSGAESHWTVGQGSSSTLQKMQKAEVSIPQNKKRSEPTGPGRAS